MVHSTEMVSVERYKAYYRFPAGLVITPDMIAHHWSLERELTERLLSSTSEDRWQVFEDSYGRLYSELPWLNEWVELADDTPAADRYESWVQLMGEPPKNVYEVGSGRGDMLRYLVSLGYRGKASEITRERSGSHPEASETLEWGVTDGVHLDRFEPCRTWDYVVSNQVIEHLHPDDLVQHLLSAREILAEDGQYILQTPHRYRGPSDVSALFGADIACGMHLKEYTYREMIKALKSSGFGELRAVFEPPRRLTGSLKWHPRARASTSYLRWAVLIEAVVGVVPSPATRRRLMSAARIVGGPSGVWIVASR